MRYQLLLRFPGDDFDDIVDLEAGLAERVGKQAAIETHDVGSDERRIWLLTVDPAHAFDDAKAVLERKGLLEASVALYRPFGGKNYTLLWPRESDLEAFPE